QPLIQTAAQLIANTPKFVLPSPPVGAPGQQKKIAASGTGQSGGQSRQAKPGGGQPNPQSLLLGKQPFPGNAPSAGQPGVASQTGTTPPSRVSPSASPQATPPDDDDAIVF
ncbi:MAG TPA: hypothetical protein VKR06_36865, partial [Ktedonosporobacter sp.]|nr:hypothetical protein [Ktedonosporobacter sp.]